VRVEERGHPRLSHPQADLVTRHPRLGDLEQRTADPVAVTDANLIIRKPLDGEVLAELAVDEVVAAELALLVAIGRHVVDVTARCSPP
jgi:hypothetical protein